MKHYGDVSKINGAEDMREAHQSTVEPKGENALCIEKFYLRLWTAAAEALREKQERIKGASIAEDGTADAERTTARCVGGNWRNHNELDKRKR